MKSSKKDTSANRVPYLRVYYGEETELPQSSAPLDDTDPPPYSMNEEVEAMWSGRTPAARLSARIAA